MDVDKDNVETFQQQALEIREPDENFDPSAKPQDGEEYLMHMLYERRQQPIVMVRPLTSAVEKPVSSSVLPDDAVFKLLTEQSEAMQNLKQTKEWKEVIVSEFLRVREHFDIARGISAKKHLENVRELPKTDKSDDWIDFCSSTKPLVSILLHLNQIKLENLLHIFCDWLREKYENNDVPAARKSVKPERDVDVVGDTDLYIDDDDDDCVGAATAALPAVVPKPAFLDLEDVDLWFGLWLYALLIGIDSRLEPDMHSTLRQIARLLIFFRSRVSLTDEDEKQPFNMLIYLIAKVFGQFDFEAFV